VTVFLDANAAIYFVEQPPGWGGKLPARISAYRAAGETLAISDLVRMECMVGPLERNDLAQLADFASFFTAPDMAVLPITAAVCDRAARTRAPLQKFPDIVVELVT
jgi:predicted nucleic acid-binding protein